MLRLLLLALFLAHVSALALYTQPSTTRVAKQLVTLQRPPVSTPAAADLSEREHLRARIHVLKKQSKQRATQAPKQTVTEFLNDQSVRTLSHRNHAIQSMYGGKRHLMPGQLF